MSETCIVCLGELGESANDLPHLSDPNVKAEYDGKAADRGFSDGVVVPLFRGNDAQTELIAHLLPCGHSLHDECLKPWVERANSCPICRQNFNQVELSKELRG